MLHSGLMRRGAAFDTVVAVAVCSHYKTEEGLFTCDRHSLYDS